MMKNLALIFFTIAASLGAAVNAVGEATHGNAGSPHVRLIGTVVVEDEPSCAIIQDLSTGIQRICFLGDMVQGVQLEEIQRGKIVLALGKRKQVITMMQFDIEDINQQHNIFSQKNPLPARSQNPSGAVRDQPNDASKFSFKRL